MDLPKKVFISILRPPVGASYYTEGLRLALGVLGATDDHEVTIAHIGKGVLCALKGVDRSYAEGFPELFPKGSDGTLFYVERESLTQEGVSESELADGFGVASRDELREKMLDSDAVFSF
ncbi:MAG: DsrE family protein [Nitrososphaerales archaeon]|jgi:sulfur relay (sulfurtransferase) DsrF/TusC family protein